jgi:hypothetical protein
MLAKCPNAMRVLRLLYFGKQNFCRAATPAQARGGGFCVSRKKIAHKQPLINVLYRQQYSLGADFPKYATSARPGNS